MTKLEAIEALRDYQKRMNVLKDDPQRILWVSDARAWLGVRKILAHRGSISKRWFTELTWII